MLEQINEPIEVEVYFGPGQVRPRKFIWHGRKYEIQKVNLTYAKRDGRVKFYYFAVSDSTNYFKLEFNTETLFWKLVEIYVE